MNWKKLLTFVLSSGVAAGLGTYVQNPAQPFNFHTVGIPAIVTIGSMLAALFTQPPHTDPVAQAKQ